MKEMPSFDGEFGGGNEEVRKVPVEFSPEPEMEVPIEQREPEEERGPDQR